MRNILHSSLALLSLGMLAFVSQDAQAASDPLAKYKLDLSNPDVCKVYYMRGGNYQALDSLKVGVNVAGNDSMAAPYPRIQYLYDGKFPDSRNVVAENPEVDLTKAANFEGEIATYPNQGFFVFDFGEQGIDLHQIAIYNSGYYKRYQQTTVFAAMAGPVSDGPFTEDCVEKKYTNDTFNAAKAKIFRTNGSAQSFEDIVTHNNHWVTGSVENTANEPGSYVSTVKIGGHIKYRYLTVYDWSNVGGLAEVEIWATQLKNTTMTDGQIDLDRAITEAKCRADEFANSDEEAVAALNGLIDAAEVVLNDPSATAEQIASTRQDLVNAVEAFMSSITFKLNPSEFFCAITTASGELGLKLEPETITLNGYTGRKFVTCSPEEACAFAIKKGNVINGQQSYQLTTEEGTVIQTGSTLMLVDVAQANNSNTANLIFTKRFSDGENALFDMKVGSSFYYIDESSVLAASDEFPAYESIEEIIPYTFTLQAMEYPRNEEDLAVLFKGWEFNEASKPVTEVYGDVLGKNAGFITEGWRQSKYRNYTRVQQHAVNGNGYLVVSVNNPYYANTDIEAATPLTPEVDKNSILTSANNTPALVREFGQYADQVATEPVNAIRDSTYLEVVNPAYTPYIAVKIAGTNPESVSLSNFGLVFFIKKGLEPKLSMSNVAGHKGDVYYWNLIDCGFTVGQIGYCAQYMSFNSVETTQQAFVIDWIRTYEDIDAIPEESIDVVDLALITGELPESPEYVDPAIVPADLKLKKLLSVKTKDGEDVSATYTAEMAAAIDGDVTKTAALPADTYYVITLPQEVRKFYTLTVSVPDASVNQYSNNVFFYKEAELNLAADTYGNYVPNGGSLWMHTGFSGTCEKSEDGTSVTFTNTAKEEFYYIAIKGDNGGNPMTLSEISMTYDSEIEYWQFDEIGAVNYWPLTTNWASTRTNGKTEVTDGGLLCYSGTDNTARADIRNNTDRFNLQDHTIVFYTCEPTNVEAVQNYGDMKFGYNALIPTFNAERAVQNEQMMRKNTDQQYMLEDGSQLIYFDIATTNPNVAFFEGNSGEKFTTEQKDAYRNAFIADEEVVIYKPTFYLIAKDKKATNFLVHKMGSAKDVDAMLEAFGLSTGISQTYADKVNISGIYDLQGNHLDAISAPGLYIVNGKTIMVK